MRGSCSWGCSSSQTTTRCDMRCPGRVGWLDENRNKRVSPRLENGVGYGTSDLDGEDPVPAETQAQEIMMAGRTHCG